MGRQRQPAPARRLPPRRRGHDVAAFKGRHGVVVGPRRAKESRALVDEEARGGGVAAYREFILCDYKQMLRIRSLLSRGRATMALETPEVIRRLFGGTATVQTRRSQPPPMRSAFLPDPIFWKVLEYYRLGDWRRPSTLPP